MKIAIVAENINLLRWRIVLFFEQLLKNASSVN